MYWTLKLDEWKSIEQEQYIKSDTAYKQIKKLLKLLRIHIFQ